MVAEKWDIKGKKIGRECEENSRLWNNATLESENNLEPQFFFVSALGTIFCNRKRLKYEFVDCKKIKINLMFSVN